MESGISAGPLRSLSSPRYVPSSRYTSRVVSSMRFWSTPMSGRSMFAAPPPSSGL